MTRGGVSLYKERLTTNKKVGGSSHPGRGWPVCRAGNLDKSLSDLKPGGSNPLGHAIQFPLLIRVNQRHNRQSARRSFGPPDLEFLTPVCGWEYHDFMTGRVKVEP